MLELLRGRPRGRARRRTSGRSRSSRGVAVAERRAALRRRRSGLERRARRGDARGGRRSRSPPSSPPTCRGSRPRTSRALVAATPDRGMAIARALDGGTNAVSMRPAGAVMTHFGEPQSAAVHALATAEAGLVARILDVPGLAFDIDTPDDLRRTAAGREMSLVLGYKASAEQFGPRELLDYSVARGASSGSTRSRSPTTSSPGATTAGTARTRSSGSAPLGERTRARAARHERADADDALPAGDRRAGVRARSPASTRAASSSASARASR